MKLDEKYWHEKKVLVAGCGISGIGAVNLLLSAGARPVLYDGNGNLDRVEIEKKLLQAGKTEIYLGELPFLVIEETELVVLSPGIPVDLPWIQAFAEKNIPIWGEIELAWHFSRGRLLAITGTNGKTTTTALLGQIMKDFLPEVFVVGNIGNPYTAEALKTTDASVTVAEISSFQLETAHDFKPDISAILNITPDHLNRHHTMENYAKTKERVAANQDKKNVCVLNYEDPYTREFGSRTCATPFYFSSARRLKEGIYLSGDTIFLAENGKEKRLLDVSEMQLLGIHNMENVMAAIAMAWHYGVPMECILKTVRKFQAVEHRIEFVASKKGVDYYNDSKGTNPDAAIQGIRAMRRPTLLIGGGYDKNSTYDEWITAFDGKVKWLVLLGQTKEAIADCAKSHGFLNIIFVKDLEEAVEVCAGKAEDGDAVLLSPACASWGMFENYEARGNRFKALVKKLED